MARQMVYRDFLVAFVYFFERVCLMMRKRAKDVLTDATISAAVIIHYEGLHRPATVVSIALIVLNTQQDLNRLPDVSN